jgi:hypothetical protein
MDPNIPTQPISQQPINKIPSSGSKWKLVLLIIILLVVVGGAYYLGTKQNTILSQNQQKTIVPSIIQSTPTVTPEKITAVPTSFQNTTMKWKTYVSTTEKVSFKYPQDWITLNAVVGTDFPDQDKTSLHSPSGEIKVNWSSAFTGLGGDCIHSGTCPLIAVIDKVQIKNASDLWVVSGTATKDGNIYEPFLAVQDGNGFLVTKREMPYIVYKGRNNGRVEYGGSTANVLFSTSGTAEAEGPQLTQSEATAWFNNPEVQQAKLILLSLTYQQ